MKKRWEIRGDWRSRRASLSPKIHNLFAKQHGSQIDYEKIRVTKGLFVAFVEIFLKSRSRFKHNAALKAEAFEIADTLDAVQKAAKQ